MTTQKVLVPDMGGVSDVGVIEVLVKVGDVIEKDASIVTLESDKASMEIPAPFAGKVTDIKVKIGDKLSQGDLILTMETRTQTSEQPKETKEAAVKETKATEKAPLTEETIPVKVPDIGNAGQVTVIEVMVKPGDEIQEEMSIITLESDKASMEIPSPSAGKVQAIKVKVGDKVSEGDLILNLLGTKKSAEITSQPATKAPEKVATASTETEKKRDLVEDEKFSPITAHGEAHAGPGVRRFARELGVDLSQIKGTGKKDRILTEDVQRFVKSAMQDRSAPGHSIPTAPLIDFAKFGAIETQPLSRIKKLTGVNLHRSWVTVPHVTQFDEADITEMEAFRNSHKKEAEKLGFKLTPLIFLMKAVVACLKQYPIFNSSLDASGENIIVKKYFHIGVAVDTPNGLVVPVVRDVDQKGLYELADELAKISKKAREKGLSPADMQGSCFTISSLGGIGGTAFTPIVNTPDVAILGVSKASMKPVYIDDEFVPRLMLPLSLSYDHRVVDGADGARFTSYLAKLLGDVRQLLF